MAKRRYISQDIVYSDDCNSLSDFEERIFTRSIAISDDFGTIPGSLNSLRQRLGIKEDRQTEFEAAVQSLVARGLLRVIEYDGKKFFALNPERFDEEQTHVKNKRKRSEYTKIRALSRKEFEEYINLQDNPRTSNLSMEKENDTKGERREERGESKGGVGGDFLSEFPGLESRRGFPEAWREWVTHCHTLWKKKRKDYTAANQRKQLAFLASQSDPVAVIEISIRNGWQGLFEIEEKRKGNAKQQLTSADITASANSGAENYRAIKDRIRGNSTG